MPFIDPMPFAAVVTVCSTAFMPCETIAMPDRYQTMQECLAVAARAQTLLAPAMASSTQLVACMNSTYRGPKP
jgi:hypothetical protein